MWKMRRWQTEMVFGVSQRRLVTFVVVVATALVGCGSDGEGLCANAISIPSFTTRFSQGLDNFSEDQYEQLRLDSLDAMSTVNSVAVSPEAPSEAATLAIRINQFISAMDDSLWDVSLALQNSDAVQSATTLGSSETLALANVVDAAVISQCGLPSTLAPLAGVVDTLPSPVIPSPSQTDPPATPPNEESEEMETARTVSNIFGLNLSDEQLICLGSALDGIVDVSSASSNLAQYQGQFQRAFDTCKIDFTVPVE